MSWLSIIAAILQFAVEVWRSRADPEQARLRAAARATQQLAEDRAAFEQALARNDAEALSAHFERLRDRVKQVTAGRGWQQ